MVPFELFSFTDSAGVNGTAISSFVTGLVPKAQFKSFVGDEMTFQMPNEVFRKQFLVFLL
jgi:hypothetical protein